MSLDKILRAPLSPERRTALTLYSLLNQIDAGVARGDDPALIHNLVGQAMDVLTEVAA